MKIVNLLPIIVIGGILVILGFFLGMAVCSSVCTGTRVAHLLEGGVCCGE